MITGTVNYRLEAIIPIQIIGSENDSVIMDAKIDTGFSGYLTLPASTILTLKLPFIETRTYLLGNGARVDFDLYAASVTWDASNRDIHVLASDSHPLMGMSLLKGHKILIHAVDGGKVRIEVRLR